MKIKFSGSYVVDPRGFGVSFEALLGEHKVSCYVTLDALQSIDSVSGSGNGVGSAESLFRANRERLQQLAERKIKAALPKRIDIAEADLRPPSQGASTV